MQTTTLPSDAELLHDYTRDGRDAAFTALVTRYQAMVLGTAYRRTENFELARDVAQEVFAALARKSGFLTGRTSLGGWLHQAAVYESVRALRSEARRQGRQHRYAEAEAIAAPEIIGEAEIAKGTTAIDEAIDALPTSDREVLVLHYFQDLSYAEMSAVLKASEPTVRKRVSRALERLGTQLNRRGVAGDIISLLIAAAAIQASVLAPVGLAHAALASAAAGAGASAFLTLTAVLPHVTVKAVLLIAALLSAGMFWQAHPDLKLGKPAVTSEQFQATTNSPAALEERPIPDPARTIVESPRASGTRPLVASGDPENPVASAVGVTTRLAGVQAINRGLVQAPAPLRAIVAPVPAPPVPPPARPVEQPSGGGTAPPGDGAAPPLGGSALELGPVAAPVAELAGLLGGSLPRALEELGGVADVPALLGELRRLELLPARAAEVYGQALGEVLGLNPLERVRVEDSLQRQFERLNTLGLAGPEASTDSLQPRRKLAVDSIVADVESAIPSAAEAAPRVVGLILKLADDATADTTPVTGAIPETAASAAREATTSQPLIKGLLGLPAAR